VLLILLPFFDRRLERRPLHRPVAMVGLVLTVIAMGVLTWKGATAKEASAGAEAVDKWIKDNNLPEEARKGAELFATSGCMNCHTYDGDGASNLGAPDLTDIGAQSGKDAAYFHRYISDPSQFGNNVMPKFASLGDENLQAIATFLAASKAGG
jgi:mono/diheme cytochrome c family protein